MQVPHLGVSVAASVVLGFMLLIDPYKIRVIVGAGEAYSKTTLWRLLAELREVSIMLDIPSREIKMLGGILSSVVDSTATRLNRLTPGQDRSMWRVTLEPSFALLMNEDLPFYYDPAPPGETRVRYRPGGRAPCADPSRVAAVWLAR